MGKLVNVLLLAIALSACTDDGGFLTQPPPQKVEQTTDCSTSARTGGSGSEAGLEAAAGADGKCVTKTVIGQGTASQR